MTSKSNRAVLGVLALFLLVLVSSAQAAPVHLPLPGQDISGLNHACGAAVDSEGDVFVASAGESKVKVFDPEHDELTSIANANEPCGLAVDGKGNLYVVEAAGGEVVKYQPTEYPFTGTASYGPREVVDSSGEAQGISVERANGRLFVAEGDRIDTFDSAGNPGTSEASTEVQRLFLPNATGGSYRLCFEGECTGSLPYNATHAAVQAALEGLTGIGAGNVAVSEGPNFGSLDHLVTFSGSLVQASLPQITCTSSSLTGPSARCFSGTSTQGFSGHVGDGELIDATGVAAYTYASGDLHIAVADAATDQVELYSGTALKQLAHRGTISGVDQDGDPETPRQEFGFGSAGASLGVEAAKGHFFLYDDAHTVVDEFDASGEYLDQVSSPEFADAEPTALALFPAQDEVQHLQVHAEGGSFTLSFEGQTTAPIAVEASKEKPDGAEIEAALAALPTVGPGNVSVFGKYVNSFKAGSYAVGFKGALGARDVPILQADSSGLSGGAPSASVTTEVGGSGPGRLYVSAGASAGAKLLTFGPLVAPSRLSLGEPLSHVLPNARAVATDSEGDVYVAAGATIHVYGPGGQEITSFEDAEDAIELAVDSSGKVYVVDGESETQATYYTPSSYPPTTDTTYTRHEPALVTSASEVGSHLNVLSVAVNPADDHVLVSALSSGVNGRVIELDSAAPGHDSAVLNDHFAAGLPGFQNGSRIGVYGANGDVYLADVTAHVYIVDPTGSEVLAQIDGSGSPTGRFSNANPAIAVDQSNGHVLVFDNAVLGPVREYDAAGGFVAEFGEMSDVQRPFRIAIDNSSGPSRGNVYVAFDDTAPGSLDVSAFGPLAYGEAPQVVSGVASEIGGGEATLNGTVDPRGADLEACRFEYVSDSTYLSNGKTFTGATALPCAESLAEIGNGSKPVAVHADLSGLDPEGRYRFRLVAENRYGTSEGDAALFGPPVLTTKSALPVLYEEATLRAGIDPSGLQTKYRFEYGTSEAYDHSTPLAELPAGDGTVAVAVPLTGLADGTTYHFRLVAENEAKVVEGPDQTLTTLARRPGETCPNPEFRIGLSAGLPDCRAYELTTPAETNGALLVAPFRGSPDRGFNNWLTPPRGPAAGGAVTFASSVTLPGFEGSGVEDGYRTERGAGAHPVEGWGTELVSPSYTAGGNGGTGASDGSSDQLYSFWRVGNFAGFEDSLPVGTYLRTPAGFEPVAQGSLGQDPAAREQFVSAGGAHVIFSSQAHLEEDAAPEGTEAIYDRAAGNSSAEVLSLKPDGSPLGAGEAATYVGSTEDGTAVAFRVGGALYLRRAGETVEVATSPNGYAGISADGKRVFFADSSSGESPADLFVCDTQAGPCAGAEATQEATQIAPDSIFLNVSADGSSVFLTSEEALTGGEENEAGEEAETGEHNLYAWDGAESSFIAQLDPQDFISFNEDPFINMTHWVAASTARRAEGLGSSPVRSNPGGKVFLFLSHARLGSYDNEGFAEVYRYAPAAAVGERLICVSCDPSGAPPDADASLEGDKADVASVPPDEKTLIENVTDDGQRVFFQSRDRLLPEDANDAEDVYEWQADSAGNCTRGGGCLALISSGQGERQNYLYSMSADGHDVFFTTMERLVDEDVGGSPSIYDARVNGGIPDRPTPAPCEGDACQGDGSIPPVISSPASATIKSQGNTSGEKTSNCAKGQRKVRKGGKTRCVAKHQKKRHHKRHRANHDRRAHR
jgi:hypothetical protein